MPLSKQVWVPVQQLLVPHRREGELQQPPPGSTRPVSQHCPVTESHC
jgi:hypothetical protein